MSEHVCKDDSMRKQTFGDGLSMSSPHRDAGGVRGREALPGPSTSDLLSKVLREDAFS